jgi:hypothetical protein
LECDEKISNARMLQASIAVDDDDIVLGSVAIGTGGSIHAWGPLETMFLRPRPGAHSILLGSRKFSLSPLVSYPMGRGAGVRGRES